MKKREEKIKKKKKKVLLSFVEAALQSCTMIWYRIFIWVAFMHILSGRRGEKKSNGQGSGKTKGQRKRMEEKKLYKNKKKLETHRHNRKALPR